MPRTVGKKTYKLKDIWYNYSDKLLADNPDWWAKFENYTRNFAIYRKANNHVEEVINYRRFVKIIRAYFRRAKKAIINGQAVNMFSSIGKLCAKRVERDFRKDKHVRINWEKTKLQPLVWCEIKKKMRYKRVIYYTNDEWCRIGWFKTKSITNESVYEFKPTQAGTHKTTGFAVEFSQALIADPLLQYQYLYEPITNYAVKKPIV